MTQPVPTLERPRSLADLVTDHLRRWIITGEMDLGTKLSEGRIAKALDVSRTPVREAISRLELEGLLKVEPQRGSFVFTLARGELGKLCDARICLEAAALTAGIRHHQAAFTRSLQTCLDRMIRARDKGDDTAYLDLDADFHNRIIAAADNVFMTEAYKTMAPRMSALRHRLGRDPQHMAKSFREHRDLTHAVRDGDLDRGLVILHSHIDRKEGNYWREFDQNEMREGAEPDGASHRQRG